MDSQELVGLFRSEMADEVMPPLWTDTEAYNYADDAQKMFARLTGGIPDSTSASMQVAFAVDDESVELDPRILKIRAAYRVSDGKEISIVNYENMYKYGLRFDGKKGPLEALVIGMDAKFAYYMPVPTIADAIQLIVDRLPLLTLKDDNAPQVLEIDEHHHRHLLLWMKSLAYKKQDAETFDKSKSKEFDEEFRKYCFDSKIEKDRKKHKPRAVTYGGIPINSNFGRRSDY